MAMRQRLVKTMPTHKYREGYPDLLFEGFRMRFGSVNAVFTNANMQSLAGLADPRIQKAHIAGGSRIPSAAWLFFSELALATEIERRKAANHNWQFLDEVAAQWPARNNIPNHLKHRIGDE